MSQKMGYLVDLFEVKLNDLASGAASSWIQAMPLGTYEHPIYGEIDFTADKIQQFADNVNNGVRGTELDIDYDHKEYGGQAAGWVKQAEARTDGLWILVEWTKQAAELIKNKAYKYFSPEFDDEWTNPKTKTTYSNVLFGGGITNRPFLKDILPLNLSEAFSAVTNNEGSGTVDPEQLKSVAKLLGLPDDATGDQILGALQVKLGVPGNEDPADPNSPDSGAPAAGEPGDGTAKIAEAGAAAAAPALSEAMIKLAEKDPAVKALMETVNAQGKQLQAQAVQLKEAAVSSTITKLSDKAKAKGFALPPTTKDALKETLMKLSDTQLSDSVVQAFDKLLDAGLVELGEKGSARNGNETPDGVKAFTEAVKKAQTDNNIDYADAVLLVSKEQPRLFTDYQKATYSFVE